VRLKIDGRTWTVREAEIEPEHMGECDHANRVIEIAPGQRPQARLDTLIHELLHAANQRKTEATVERLAAILTDALWRDGWRRNLKDR
jgi:hypothetical protein